VNLDDALDVSQPARDWSRKFAGWSKRSPEAAERALQRHLQAERAVPVGDVRLLASDTHADYFGDPRVAYLAEVRALPLVMPNPMPHVRLFGRSRCRA
jgi:hypothetical protein